MTRSLNAYSLLLLAFFTGAFVNLGLISSTALYLSTHSPLEIIRLTVVSSIFVALFLRTFKLKKIKFSVFTVIFTVCYIALLLMITRSWFPQVLVGYTWVITSLIARVLYKWILSDLTIRHINSADAKAYFSYMNSAYEFGTLCVMLYLIQFNDMSINGILYSVAELYGFYVLVLLVVFVPRHNIEIRFRRKSKTVESGYDTPNFRRVVYRFILLSMMFGIFDSVTDYMVKLVIKQDVVNTADIRRTFSTIYLYASSILIFSSYGIGQFVRRNRLSPLRLYINFCLVIIFAATACLGSGSLNMYVAFGVIFIVCLKTLHAPATQIMLSFFPSSQRNMLNSRINLWYGVIANIITFELFSIADTLLHAHSKTLLPMLTIGLASVLILLVAEFNEILLYFFRKTLDTTHKIASIMAVEALSYLHPKDYDAQMANILAQNPKKLLRKTVIMGLGSVHSPNALTQLQHQFDSEQTEIQLAVIEALKHDSDILAVKFILDILLNRKQSTNRLVRFNACRLLATIYGRKAVPILLLGLEDEDVRLKANVIEVLSWIKDKSLIKIFSQYVDAPNNRLRANALMGLMQFSGQRNIWHQKFKHMLFEEDGMSCASALYVLGAHPNRQFLPDILAVYHSPLADKKRIQGCLAWCLYRYRHPLGNQLFVKLLMELHTVTGPDSTLHFFAQLPSRDRFRILEYIIFHANETHENIMSLFQVMKASHYDFHEEGDFILTQLAENEPA